MKHDLTPCSAWQILKNNGRDELDIGDLRRVVLPASRSRLVQRNGGVLYGWMAYGLEGLFRKDIPATLAYGRQLCDRVREAFNCSGFLTSDELPRYGINRAETREMFVQMDKTPHDGNVIILCAYERHLARQIQLFVVAHVRQECASVCSGHHWT